MLGTTGIGIRGSKHLVTPVATPEATTDSSWEISLTQECSADQVLSSLRTSKVRSWISLLASCLLP